MEVIPQRAIGAMSTIDRTRRGSSSSNGPYRDINQSWQSTCGIVPIANMLGIASQSHKCEPCEPQSGRCDHPRTQRSHMNAVNIGNNTTNMTSRPERYQCLISDQRPARQQLKHIDGSFRRSSEKGVSMSWTSVVWTWHLLHSMDIAVPISLQKGALASREHSREL